jgi:hypothetical protein
MIVRTTARTLDGNSKKAGATQKGSPSRRLDILPHTAAMKAGPNKEPGRLEDLAEHQSARKASTGSTAAARRAGK